MTVPCTLRGGGPPAFALVRLALALGCPIGGPSAHAACEVTAPELSSPWSEFRASRTADRRSLEELLAEARAEREKVHAAMLPQIQELVATLDALERRSRDVVASTSVDKLVAFGSDAAPLLVQFLDPGETASKAQLYRAERIAEALVRLKAVSITDTLLERARTGSLHGRLNALEVLGASPEPDRVAPALEALAGEVQDVESNPMRPVRLAALRALARLGGPAAQAILVQSLREGSIESADAALRALVEVRAAQAAPAIVALMGTPRGTQLAFGIASYLAAVPTALEASDAVETVIRLCARDGVVREARIALLEVLRRNDAKRPSSVKRELDGLRESLDQGVRRAALVYLARQKDRAAKRDLFEAFDEQIKADRNDMLAYEGRAELSYLIGDHSAAIRDWRDALRLRGERNAPRSAAPYVGLARSLALTGKYKEAADYLRDAPMAMSNLHELAKDPDFAGMLESKYREAFHLPEDDGKR